MREIGVIARVFRELGFMEGWGSGQGRRCG